MTHTCSPQAQLSTSSKKLLSADGDRYGEWQREMQRTYTITGCPTPPDTLDKILRQKPREHEGRGQDCQSPGLRHLLQASFFWTGKKYMADCTRHAKVTQANMQTWREISQSTTPRERATGKAMDSERGRIHFSQG